MDNIISAINLLEAVYTNMNQISVVGIENQDRFVGCANAIQTVSQTLGEFLQEAQQTVTTEEQEEANGR